MSSMLETIQHMLTFSNPLTTYISDRNQQTHIEQHHVGFWGHPSATVDWCEPNYVYSHYIAEFFNTFSSFAMVVVGLLGMALHYRDFEQRFIWAFASVVVVGIGSAAFHGTLLFGLQMMDELPMIYSALIMSYCVIQQPYKQPRFAPYLAIGMALHALIATVLVASPALAPAYASPTLQFLLFHFSFALLEIFILSHAFLIWRNERDPKMRRVHVMGGVLWVSGIVFWVLDYAGCEPLWEGPTSFRERFLMWHVPLLGMKLGVPNPQFHSWWHASASAGLYLLSLAVAKNRMVVLGKRANIRFYYGIVPYVSVLDEERKVKPTKQAPASREEEKDDTVLANKDALADGVMRRSPRRRGSVSR